MFEENKKKDRDVDSQCCDKTKSCQVDESNDSINKKNIRNNRIFLKSIGNTRDWLSQLGSIKLEIASATKKNVKIPSLHQ